MPALRSIVTRATSSRAIGSDEPAGSLRTMISLATAWISTVPLKAEQLLHRHSTIQMTMRYAHLGPQVTRDAVNLLLHRPAATRSTTSASASSRASHRWRRALRSTAAR